MLESTHGQGLNEKELLADFLTDVFVHVLGYHGPADPDATGGTISRERTVVRLLGRRTSEPASIGGPKPLDEDALVTKLLPSSGITRLPEALQLLENSASPIVVTTPCQDHGVLGLHGNDELHQA